MQSEVYQDLLKKLEEIKSSQTSKEIEPKERWLDNNEYLQYLKICKRTGQRHRDSGLIPFAQIGSKIYYKLSDVEAMLLSHYNKTF